MPQGPDGPGREPRVLAHRQVVLQAALLDARDLQGFEGLQEGGLLFFCRIGGPAIVTEDLEPPSAFGIFDGIHAEVFLHHGERGIEGEEFIPHRLELTEMFDMLDKPMEQMTVYRSFGQEDEVQSAQVIEVREIEGLDGLGVASV